MTQAGSVKSITPVGSWIRFFTHVPFTLCRCLIFDQLNCPERPWCFPYSASPSTLQNNEINDNTLDTGW